MQNRTEILDYNDAYVDLKIKLRVTSFRTGDSYLITAITAIRGYISDNLDKMIGRTFKDKESLTKAIKKQICTR